MLSATKENANKKRLFKFIINNHCMEKFLAQKITIKRMTSTYAFNLAIVNLGEVSIFLNVNVIGHSN